MITYTHNDDTKINQLLIGRKVTKVDVDRLLLDDGTQLQLVGNDGCPGCWAGDFSLTELNGVDNIITDVQVLNAEPAGWFQIFVFADNQKISLARFEGREDNGWYGTGYRILVNRP